MSNLYAKVFARFYDKALQRAEDKVLAERRRALLSGLKGNILEVGAGTGVNFQFYPKDANVLALEPSPFMLKQALEKKKDNGHIRLLQSFVEDAMIQSESMDTIVCTLVLCTIPDPKKALQFFYQWLKPGGKLIVLEHIRSPVSWRGSVQDILTPAWKVIGEGCHLNRNTDHMIKQTGFQTLEEDYFSYLFYWYQGIFSKV